MVVASYSSNQVILDLLNEPTSAAIRKEAVVYAEKGKFVVAVTVNGTRTGLDTFSDPAKAINAAKGHV